MSCRPERLKRIMIIAACVFLVSPSVGRASFQAGEKSEIKISLFKVLGRSEEDKDVYLYRMPSDIAMDSGHHIYVLDALNKTISVYDEEWKFQKKFGKEGQGPGDFNFPVSLDISASDEMIVLDSTQRKIKVFVGGSEKKQIPLSSREAETVRFLSPKSMVSDSSAGLGYFMNKKNATLPKILHLVNEDGNALKEFGEMKDFHDSLTTYYGNKIEFDADRRGNVYVAFKNQNRIEKYSNQGDLIWSKERRLNYDVTVIKNGKVNASEGSVSIDIPELAVVSTGISVDDSDRIWVLTYRRQFTDAEKKEVVFGQAMTSSVKSDQKEKKDLLVLEVFSSDGEKITEFNIPFIAHKLRICGNNLFLINKADAYLVHYKLSEK